MKRDSIDFGSQPVGQLFRKMLIPTMLGMVSLVILNISDGAFVGHGAGSRSLAAVNIVGPVFLILSGIGLMFGIGGSVVASIHLSKGENKAADINITQALIGSVSITVVISALLIIFREQACRLFGASDLLVPEACIYMVWLASFMPLAIISEVGMFIIRLDGSPKVASAIMIAGAALNILLDYIMVFPLHMGLRGAAIATSICYALSGVMALVYIAFFSKVLHLHKLKMSLKSLCLTLRNIGYQIKIGFSALLGDLAIAFLMIIGNYQFIKYLAEDGVAAFSVSCYCLPIIFMVANSIVQSIQPIISFAYGNNNPARIDSSLRLALKTGIISGLAVTVLMVFGSEFLSTVFLPKECAAWAICRDGLPLFSSCVIFLIVNVILVGYCQSLEKGGTAAVFTLLRGFVFLIPAFLILPVHFGAHGLWTALAVSEILTCIVMAATMWINKIKITKFAA